MGKFEEFKVMYIPTKVVFTLPKPDLDNIMKNDRGNYKVLDERYELPKEEFVIETSTYEKVVSEYDSEARKKELNKMKVLELMDFCDKNNITYEESYKKADFINAIVEFEQN
ncbi:hypothetical protein IJI31_06460 [bacterium]|nr:hypothetical protein [bacterium]